MMRMSRQLRLLSAGVIVLMYVACGPPCDRKRGVFLGRYECSLRYDAWVQRQGEMLFLYCSAGDDGSTTSPADATIYRTIVRLTSGEGSTAGVIESSISGYVLTGDDIPLNVSTIGHGTMRLECTAASCIVSGSLSAVLTSRAGRPELWRKETVELRFVDVAATTSNKVLNLIKQRPHLDVVPQLAEWGATTR